MRPGDTPVLIPNTMVKTRSADGTILETVWESRWMPLHCFLSEDERKRSLRLENKYTLRSEAMVLLHFSLDESEQSEAWILVKKYTSSSETRWWCFHKKRSHQYSFGEDERCWSSNLQISLLRQKALTTMYLENCIPNEKLYKYFIIRHPRY